MRIVTPTNDSIQIDYDPDSPATATITATTSRYGGQQVKVRLGEAELLALAAACKVEARELRRRADAKA